MSVCKPNEPVEGRFAVAANVNRATTLRRCAHRPERRKRGDSGGGGSGGGALERDRDGRVGPGEP